MEGSLKEKTIASMIWRAVQGFGNRIILFIANLVLARLLSPDDFGCIGMLMIFLSILNVFINGGFSLALLQKKNVTRADYSTAFYWNLVVSLVAYLLLFYFSPAISVFYRIPLLSTVLRVQGLALIFNALSVVQITILQQQLNFKRIAIYDLISVSIACSAGIVTALLGWGVWSLVLKMMLYFFVNSLILWYCSSWKPELIFSIKSFKSLFGFGSFMFFSNLMRELYQGIPDLIIGRFYSARKLGFYTQARKLEEIPVVTLATIVSSVSFPVYSKIRDDKERLIRGVRKNQKAITFINFPLMVWLIVIAKPLFLILFTEKWSESIPYFQLFCMGGMMITLVYLNKDLITSLGNSKKYFFIEIIYEILGIILMLGGVWLYGIEGLLGGYALSYYLLFLISSLVTGKLVQYGFVKQVKDIGMNFVISLFTGFVVYFISFLFSSCFYLIVAQTGVYLLLYIGLARLLHIEGYQIFWEIVRDKFIKIND
ncbi:MULTISPECIES: lipopolysaccharide biosynthesis protein [Sanguibacteroides]|uniref:Lipopolysaccharide biosynthesis protein n=1 Tax=Sanguibacteroides justesenii TaxID=1547597 RepID=A0AB34R6B2_9PORP|nr:MULTISPECIES: lipopolysaccharide biosynthesis protein [Sanguibacteroides]KIO46304.1 hypothetical protein IE90_05790 [Sanguibacteroides justesenii]PXZ44364.1 lipopolysaccharide biosynthesis protein [Sanguibacteroides justesenii]